MPTVNMVLGGWLQSFGGWAANARKHPKSTAQGIITALIGFVPFLVLFHLTSPTFAASLGGVLGGTKILIAGMQADPGQTPAIPPGGGAPEMVPSHETPDDPKFTPAPEGTANPTQDQENHP